MSGSAERSDVVAPRTPNYRQARSDRTRAKEERKQERLRHRERESLARKAAREPESDELARSPEDATDGSPPALDR
jgi:hypothetical protein